MPCPYEKRFLTYSLKGKIMKKTRVCDLFGITYPIIQGGMAWASRAELAAAVSEAGGLGIIGAASMGPEELESQINLARKLTSKPFGDNIPIMSPLSEKSVDVCIRMKAPAVFTSAGNPARFTPVLKQAGIIVAHVVANVKMALGAESKGVDAVVCEGFEAGGHDGVDMLTTMSLTPQAVDAVKIPVIAAGGICDARGIVAAFALGAEGVQLGTRFVAVTENNVHPNFKRLIVEAGDTGTVFIGMKHGPVRVLKNKISMALAEAEAQCREDFTVATEGLGRGSSACIEGNVDEGLFNCSQAAGLIIEIKSAKEVIRELVEGYDKIVQKL